MIFTVDDVPIYFPYSSIYPEQLNYIKELINLLKTTGHSLIEMPSGTGKTIALLSASVSFQMYLKKNNKPSFKIAYCSRTVPEIDKALKELENLYEFINKHEKINFLGIGLASRKHLCINPKAKIDTDRICRLLTAPWSITKCDFLENLEKFESFTSGVYSIEKLKLLSIEKSICPYFLARKLLPLSDCIIYTYNYLLDPHISDIVSKSLPSNTLVIFDEAHNIDNSAIEALTIELKRYDLDVSTKCIKIIENKIKEMKLNSYKILETEYLKLKNNLLKNTSNISESIPPDFNECEFEFVPGNLRNAIHFVSVLKRLIEFFKTRLKSTHLSTETPINFSKAIKETLLLDRKTLTFTSYRFNILISTLKSDEDLRNLKKVVDFITLLSLHNKGFSVIYEPYDTSGLFSPVLTLSCLDSSIVFKKIFKRFSTVVITSGTLSPISMYPKILGFVPVKSVEIGVTLARNSVLPLIITKGNDQMIVKAQEIGKQDNKIDPKTAVTTSFSLRSDPSIVRNYGSLVIEFSKVVPDGMVVFFPSYLYMEEIVTLWCEMGVITEISKNKLVFCESVDNLESEKALENYRLCCENGRGGVLFCIARGKVSEGVDFSGCWGRCCIVIGVPFQYVLSVKLKKRLEFLRSLGIKESDFLNFDAMRQCAQCLGRVLRSKNDYGLMVMADHRFEKSDKKNKLPKWILSCMEDGCSNLSVDMAINIARRFFREMAQEFDMGKCVLEESEVKRIVSVKDVIQ
ncbi:DNA repair helicase Rad3 [Hamiltosporidium tvaerminnensis]|uniref:DNA 5'-3' helicase n=1 Tax=Hamiltosporidium tvaerminnensis TaxID=1176355 RepID=A0A4Q9LAP2_9MICR|nr:TFIIH/NER complex ATP-dependent 5'-3' DNA helicase subunit [Hamiltosporidium tvaerminnensis]TBU04859.1 DNA repair helicase Rad3 [Hamiltosporidium tvaerminnensis]